MTAVIVVVIIVAVLAIVVAVLVVRSRRPDTVEVFQRQIDALSPEARKPVVEQLQQLDERGHDQSPEAPDELDVQPPEDDEGGR